MLGLPSPASGFDTTVWSTPVWSTKLTNSPMSMEMLAGSNWYPPPALFTFTTVAGRHDGVPACLATADRDIGGGGHHAGIVSFSGRVGGRRSRTGSTTARAGGEADHAHSADSEQQPTPIRFRGARCHRRIRHAESSVLLPWNGEHASRARGRDSLRLLMKSVRPS